MASTMSFANNNLEAFSNLALAQFEKLFWDACKDQEWALLSNQTGGVIDSKVLHHIMQDMLFGGPSEKISKTIPDDTGAREIQELPVESTEEAPVATPSVSPSAPSVCAKIDPKKVKGLTFKGAKVDLPYMPDLIDYTKCCQGVRINGGLLSPCLTHVKEGGFCKPCRKLHDEGKADGTLADRQAAPMGQFASKKSGKKEISFATYLAKRDSTITEFNTFLATEIGANFQIPMTEEYTSIDKKKAKKSTKKSKEDGDASSSSESDSEPTPKRKPGRPKGSGKNDESSPAPQTQAQSIEDALFADDESAAEAAESASEELRKERADKVADFKKKLVEKEVISENDKIVTATIDTENDRVVEAVIEKANDDDDAEDIEVNMDDDEDDDDDGVTHFVEDGVRYARDEENSVFKINDEGDPEECVGSWDPIAKKVILVDSI